MPLVSILDELKKARAGGYAIPCFDTVEMSGTLGIFDALEAKRAPAMIGLYTGMFERPDPRAFTDYVRALSELTIMMSSPSSRNDEQTCENNSQSSRVFEPRVRVCTERVIPSS